jgi:hypothetical protein
MSTLLTTYLSIRALRLHEANNGAAEDHGT